MLKDTRVAEIESPTPTKISSLWKVEDVAEFLRLGKKAVYALVEGGGLPCIRIGSRLRFAPPEVENWVRKGQSQDGAKE